MATKLYPTTGTNDYATGNNDTNLRGSAVAWVSQLLSTTAGGALSTRTTATAAGPTAGIEVWNGTEPFVWYSLPLDADVTISGSITWNIWARESTAAANTAINGQIEKVDGATGAITLIDRTARTTELPASATTNSVINFSETPAAGVACKRGDRLRVRIFGDDSSANMGASLTFTVGYSGPTGAADGDTWVQLTENLTFASEPAGTQVFLTDTASAVSTASVDKEAWTSRGAGVTSIIRNTAAGWTVPLQMTDTAGGTVVDWFTRPLAAFTLGGAVRCNIRPLESNGAANASMAIQVAVVAGDGTSPVVWGIATHATEVATSETARSFLVSGDDVAVSDGQRIRIRVLIDDYTQTGPMGASQTVTLFYAGTSGGASGDTYMTFTQALTEFSAGPTYVPARRDFQQMLAH